MERRRRGGILWFGLGVAALALSATGLAAAASQGGRTVQASPAAATASPAAGALQRRTFRPQADAYVSAWEPVRNYGDATRLRLDGDPRRRAYLRFDVGGLDGRVVRATLRLYATSTSRRPFSVFPVSGAWAEGEISQATAPALAGAAVDRSGPVVAARWVTLDVTALVRRGREVSMALGTGSPTAVALASRESVAPPVLVVLVDSGGTAPRTPVPARAVTPTPAPAGTGVQSDAPADPSAGSDPSAPSALTAPVPAAVINALPPAVTGLAVVGARLTATPGTWTGTGDLSYAYGWSRCDAAGDGCAPIDTPDADGYTVAPDDLGATIRVSVTATDAAGSASAVSSATLPVVPAIAPPPPAATADPVIAAAGDIACDPSDGNFSGKSIGTCQMRATSDLLVNGGLAGVLTLGDNQYESNTYTNYLKSFDPTWGRVKALIHPAIGNHEYLTSKAAGYFQYFGAAAGSATTGYYSYDIGAWHLIALNSNCSQVGGCGAGSPQEKWLRADLAAHPTACTLAYWHHPRFSSGEHGNNASTQPLFQALYDAGAEIVLGGHDHDYERFAPQTPTGKADPGRGIRQFVVGTGGKNHYGFKTPIANSEVRSDTTYGVLKLTLHPAGYDWQFAAQAGGTFSDAGSAACH